MIPTLYVLCQMKARNLDWEYWSNSPDWYRIPWKVLEIILPPRFWRRPVAEGSNNLRIDYIARTPGRMLHSFTGADIFASRG